ncbi:unnamed protein product, partial [marine sediment metagenome]
AILLLDEPTSFLDLKHQVGIYDLLKRMQLEKGKTIVAVTHDINLAAQYADVTLLLGADGSYQYGRAPANAKTAIGDRPHSVQLNPLMTAIIVPSPAPLDIPSIYGSARGLRKSAWKTTPEHASAAPTMQARIIRGSLTCTNIS